jgi:hypothetical protein
MSHVQNRHYFIFFSIFFVVCSPFLVFLSFGYDVNLRDQNISSTLSMKIDSLPKNALIKVKNETKGTSPAELYSQDQSPFFLSISLPDYLSETFLLAPENGKNSSIDLKNLFLLPKKGDSLKITNKIVVNKDYEVLNFLSKDQVIAKTSIGFEIRDFGVGGFVNNPVLISEREVFGVKTAEKIFMEGPTIEFLKKDKSKWQRLSDGSFINQNYILQKKVDFWLIKDISNTFTNGIKKIIKIDSNNYLVLDKLKNLWLWDGQTTKFVDNGFDSMESTISPEYVWLVRNNSIFKVQNDSFLNAAFDWKPTIYLKSDLINVQDEEFKVAPLFQGIGFLVGKRIFYVPDFANNSWSVLSNDATNFFTVSDSVFWLDSNNYPHFYNFFTKQGYVFRQIPAEYSEIFYLKDWNRVMIYSKNKVASIWFNKEIYQPNIIEYSSQEWINDSNCLSKIVEKVQYCIKDGDLVLYKNNLIF